ncbi:MAG TPA: monovalent cation:proton antiporter-2 (CPA2) family protein, partial [Kofleriaceae bacterium]
MTESVLAQAFVYLCAAVIFVPIAKRLGLGAVLGYLVAGVVIGPWVFGFVGDERHSVQHFSEFGVVMMLFVVGLELRPSLLWQMRRPIFGLGTAQVVACAAAIAGGAMLFGVDWKPAVAVGLTFAMSSTAIVLSTLAERGLLKTSGGQASFSVLLFQDISVIPILAVFPVLGIAAIGAAGEASRPAWQSALLSIGAVVGVFVIGRYLVRPLFHFLARARLRESFTAAALLIVIGIALLMQTAGLSPALGTFLAGVLLADSEYRHELETDIEPFKGLLLGLFFITVGAQLDFGLIANEPLNIAGLVVGVIALKLVILRVLGKLFGLDRPARWLLAFALAQVGEFAFVLLKLGVDERVFSDAFARPLVAVVAISMALTPPLFIALERWVLPRVTERGSERPQDEIKDADAPVIIAGYGRFGQIVGRILRAAGFKATILDLDPAIIDMLSNLGVKTYYGDASRLDLLHAAGCERAKLFVIAVDDPEETKKIAEHVRHNFPHLPVIARCRSRTQYWDLRQLGIKHVFRETFAASYETGIMALRMLGYRAFTAQRLAQRWREHEEALIEESLDAKYDDDATYWERARVAMAEAEKLMRQENPNVLADDAW